ncbi:hypothetical protein CEXT_796401 [Caerostris extrusa]|uniref:Uncharacterized protein n=1 Tax=Caerostris extrusa TaxID=172846 RepID=A0AAV4VFN0_CAEEX|nr:hypothetical protein CEXT_796401 [Caerostris extrusa]
MPTIPQSFSICNGKSSFAYDVTYLNANSSTPSHEKSRQYQQTTSLFHNCGHDKRISVQCRRFSCYKYHCNVVYDFTLW